MKLFDLNDPRFYRQSNKKEESVFPPLINQTVAVAAKSALFWAPKGAQKGSFQFALNLETRLVFPVGRARFEARCRRDHRRDATRRTGRGKGGGGFTPWKERGCRGDPMKRQLAEWKCNTRPHVTRKHAGGVVRAGHPLPLDDLWVRACVPRNCHFVNALLLLLARGLSWGGAWERVTSSNWREDSSWKTRSRLHAAWISGSALHLEPCSPLLFFGHKFSLG